MGQVFYRARFGWILGVSVLCLVGYGWVRVHQKGAVESSVAMVPVGIQDVSETSTSVRDDTLKAGLQKAGDDVENKDQEASVSVLDKASAALNDPNVAVRMEAILALKKLDNVSVEAVGILARFLGDREDAVVSEVIDTLGYIGLNSNMADTVFEILKEKALDKSFVGHRGEALIMAATVGEEKLLSVMPDIIAERSEAANDFAARALAVIQSENCLPYLEQLLKQSRESKVRTNVLDLLARIGSTESLALLDTYSLSGDDRDQVAGVGALARMNLPEINDKLADQVLQGRLDKDSLRAIARSAAAPEVFAKLLQSGDSDDRQRISWLQTLDETATIGPAERRARLSKAVSPLLNDPNPEIQIGALNVIAKGGDPQSDELLGPALQSPDEEVRKAGMDALIGYVRPDKYKNLFQYMWDENESVRREAFMMASVFADESDREEFEKLQKHTDPVIAKHSTQYMEAFFKDDTTNESEKQVNP
jgi:HEAT repeat protein